MLSMQKATSFITPNVWFAMLDLKDAYFHTLIHENSRKYLRFTYSGTTYACTVLPFVFTTASRVFTKFVAEVITHLKLQGCTSRLLTLCWWITNKELKFGPTHNNHWGFFFFVNREKSCLCPIQSVDFIGASLGSQTGKHGCPLPG